MDVSDSQALATARINQASDIIPKNKQETSSAVTGAIKERLGLLIELESIEKDRKEIEKIEDCPKDVADELNRQRREADRYPPVDALQKTFKKLNERLAPPKKSEEAENAEAIPEGEAESEPAAPHPLMVKALQLGIKQCKLIAQRFKNTTETIDVCCVEATEEPMFQLLHKFGFNPKTIFGYMVYYLYLERTKVQNESIIKDVKAKSSEIKQTPSGYLSNISIKKNDEQEQQQQQLKQLENKEEIHRTAVAAVNREIKAITKNMVEEFWRLYEAAAIILVTGQLDSSEETSIRAFLRYGLLGCSAKFIAFAKAQKMLSECVPQKTDFKFSMKNTFILYADEYIESVVNGRITPSFNEDLELNGRNTPEWNADKAWRRIVFSNLREAMLKEIYRDVAKSSLKYRARQENMEKMPKDPTIKQKIQELKVEAGRLERIAERVKTEYIPKEQDNRNDATEKLGRSGVALSKKAIATQEAKSIRRVCKLIAQLKEPFLPFALRDNYAPENGLVNNREEIEKILEDCEKKDHLLFKEPLIPVNKKSQRIYLRYSPTFLIAPAEGHMPFMWNPRNGSEVGKIALPVMCARTGMIEPLIWENLSDFRFDTSKASAGVDLMTSDTLVAAYANVRWAYRKKSKEFRQKAAIYTEENERKNWRRHYSLYMKSAYDDGKLLFFKCFELYDMIINKFIDLPDGCEKLKK